MIIFYWLFAALTNVVYSFISPFFVLIEDLSKYYFFDIIDVENFKTKVYVVLGVLMLFKLVISAVQYLVNPDTFDDKSKGLGNLLKKIVLSVSLLVIVPTLFDYAIKVQSLIVERIPTVILGDGSTANYADKTKSTGDKITTDILRSVLQPKEKRAPKLDASYVNGPSDFFTVATSGCRIRLSNIFEDLFWGDSCDYDMMVFIALPVGIYLIFLLISLAIDIATRTIKFGLVELLSPIPIAGYITDEKKLSTWASTAGQIYADLFIRMGIIYFVLFFIEKVLNGLFKSNGYPQEFVDKVGRTPDTMEIVLIKVFIVVALLLFAKNAPKFICDLLGIKAGDESIANMFKRAGGFMGAALGGFRTARSNYTTQKERYDANHPLDPNATRGKKLAAKLKARGAGLLSAGAGFGSAAGRGMYMSSQGKGFGDVRKNSFADAVKARDARNDKLDNVYNRKVEKYIDDPNRPGHKMLNPEYYGFWEYHRDKSRSNLGIPSTPGFQKAVYDAMESMEKAAGAEKNFGATKMNETPNDIFVKIKGKDYTIATARAYANLQVGTTVTKPDGTTGVWTVEDAANAAAIKEKVEKQTAYLKTAALLAANDPSAKQNRDATLMAINDNRTMFNTDTDFPAALRSYIFDDKGNPKTLCESSKKWNDKLINITGIDDIVRYIKEGPGDNPTREDIEGYAELMKLYKSVFEDVSQRKNMAAHAAEARAKKTQQAIQNEKK